MRIFRPVCKPDVPQALNPVAALVSRRRRCVHRRTGNETARHRHVQRPAAPNTVHQTRSSGDRHHWRCGRAAIRGGVVARRGVGAYDRQGAVRTRVAGGPGRGIRIDRHPRLNNSNMETPMIKLMHVVGVVLAVVLGAGPALSLAAEQADGKGAIVAPIRRTPRSRSSTSRRRSARSRCVTTRAPRW
ncbi:MAG: hypothetical protein MZV65_44955 [Chromatiales bacterium]|nr:hypothetical protein [Chromatiales bacterium]